MTGYNYMLKNGDKTEKMVSFGLEIIFDDFFVAG